MEVQMNRNKWTMCALSALLFTTAFAQNGRAQTNVASPNPKVPGFAAPNILSPELTETIVAQGSMKLENPSVLTSFYGYDNDGPFIPMGSPASEATKTEPDKNTYLVLHGLHGADPNYDYGSHFLYQGHESGTQDAVGAPEKGYITRVNLDADGAHRVTLMATEDIHGAPLPDFDGSVWYPFSRHLLFSAELGGTTGGVWQMPPDYSTTSTVEDISGVTGRGGYEGMQADNLGNLIIIEDSGGSTGAVNSHARQPNSFIFRLVPYNPADLTLGGKLQVLRVISLSNPGQPIVFHPGAADADILSTDVKDLHTYGKTFQTKWVTIHDTSVNGFTPFDANALAKSMQGTPFKRPENGQFRPRSGFTEFFFDETGDTNASTEAGSAYGGFGGIFVLRTSPSSDSGRLSLFYLGDVDHTGFDNTSFWSEDEIVFVEDAGDGLHTSRNALDSAYLFDLHTDYSNPANQPVRILAQGRDPSATIDSLFGFLYNDGDNEITGWHQSDGDPTIRGLIGTRVPTPFRGEWRTFYTQQHGDNVTYEVLAKFKRHRDEDREDDRRDH